MSLYAYVILFSFLGPFALSFDKKIAFYKEFRHLFFGLIITAFAFILWDEYFTSNKIWGFNPTYLLRIYIGHLPLEEILFFLIVPYNCVFIHQVLKGYFPQAKMTILGKWFFILFGVSGLFFAVYYFKNWYTMSACLLSFFFAVWTLLNKPSWMGNCAFTYIVCLIPFVIVNGILTGAITPAPIVWYSDNHIIGWRIITIPFEDLYYNFSLLFPIIALFERSKARSLR
jgi:lycopene cyclase domain-containing protein